MTTSTVTTPAHYIDGNAEQVRNAINFHKFELDTSTLSIEENDLLLSLPQVDSVCVIKTNPNKSGSAFAQMKEYGIIAGFMRGHDKSIRVLVVYTERPNDDGTFEYGFVSPSQIKHVPKKVG
jgi:hypothetical protein